MVSRYIKIIFSDGESKHKAVVANYVTVHFLGIPGSVCHTRVRVCELLISYHTDSIMWQFLEEWISFFSIH